MEGKHHIHHNIETNWR